MFLNLVLEVDWLSPINRAIGLTRHEFVLNIDYVEKVLTLGTMMCIKIHCKYISSRKVVKFLR